MVALEPKRGLPDPFFFLMRLHQIILCEMISELYNMLLPALGLVFDTPVLLTERSGKSSDVLICSAFTFLF